MAQAVAAFADASKFMMLAVTPCMEHMGSRLANKR